MEDKNKIVNEVEIVKIGQRILTLEDERVEKYKKGEYTQLDFLSKVTNKDPFYISNGTLHIVTDIDKQMIARSREMVHKGLQVDQGDIDCTKLYEHRDIVVEVYPELYKVIENVEKDIEGKPDANKCGITRRTNPILLALLKIKPDGRDIAPMKSIVGTKGMRRLKGQDIKFNESALKKDKIYKRFC